jgi:hypothetical protein
MPRFVVNPESPSAWQIELKPGLNTVGRADGNDFIIPDPSVSGRHCQILVDEAKTVLKDLHSTNGTYLNGAPVQESLLKDGQTVHLGSIKMIYFGGAGTAPPSSVPASASAPTTGPKRVSTVSIPVRMVARPVSTGVAVPAGKPAPPGPVAPAPVIQKASAPVTLVAPPSIPAPVPAPPPPPIPATSAPPLAPPVPQNCNTHTKAPARFYCRQCQVGFCELCVNTKPVGGVAHKFCRSCGAECVTLPGPAKAQAQKAHPESGFFARLPSAFGYPFRGSGVMVLIAGAIILGALNLLSGGGVTASRFTLMPTSFGFTLLFSAMAVGYLFAFLQTIVHSTAVGEEEMPPLPSMSDFWQDILLPCLQLLGLMLICFGPAAIAEYLAIFMQSEMAAMLIRPLQIAGCVYFPMAFLAVAMLDSILAANPLQVIPSIFKVPLQYIVALGVLWLVLIVYGFGDELVISLFPRGFNTRLMSKLLTMIALRAAWGIGSLYLLTVTVRILGLLYLTCKNKLNWYQR